MYSGKQGWLLIARKITRDYIITGSGSKRGSLGGGSDLGLEDHPRGFPGEPGHLPPPGGGLHNPANTDQYYADQYDQYYRWLEYDPTKHSSFDSFVIDYIDSRKVKHISISLTTWGGMELCASSMISLN